MPLARALSKHFKPLLAVLLVFAMALPATACGSSGGNNTAGAADPSEDPSYLDPDALPTADKAVSAEADGLVFMNMDRVPEEDEIVRMKETLLHLTLTQGERVPDKETADRVFLAVLDRLSILCEGQPWLYEIKNNGRIPALSDAQDTLSVYLPADVFTDPRCLPPGDTDFGDLIKEYICRPMDMSLLGISSENTSTTEPLDLPREAVTSVVMALGPFDAVDPADLETEPSHISRLTITFDKDYFAEHADFFEQAGEDLSIIQDITRESSYYHRLYPTDDPGTYEVIYYGPRYMRLGYYIMMTEPLPYGMTYYYDEPVEWFEAPGPGESGQDTGIVSESADDGTADKEEEGAPSPSPAGVNIVSRAELSDTVLTLRLDPGYNAIINDSTTTETENALKARLDALDVPYAIGRYTTSPDSFIIDMDPGKHVGTVIIELLRMADPLSVKTGETSIQFNEMPEAVLVPIEKNGTVEGLELDASSRAKAPVAYIVREALNGDGVIELCVGKRALMSAPVPGPVGDGRLTFTEGHVIGVGSDTEEDAWFYKLLGLCAGDGMSISYSITYGFFDRNGDLVYDLEGLDMPIVCESDIAEGD